jgi:glycerol-3-phosphate dehydrogenase (NAD(P)+)
MYSGGSDPDAGRRHALPFAVAAHGAAPQRNDMNLSIIGGGSWGTALAIVLAPRFQTVRLWLHEADLAARMESTRENDVFLPGLLLPQNVAVGARLEWALEGAGIVLGVMPSQHARLVYSGMLPHLNPDAIIVSATKGIERDSLLRMSEVIEDVLQAEFEPKVAVLSGPTFAREVARGEPAAVVVAAADESLAREVQAAFSGPTFRLYTNSDPIGVEVGAALKNVIAIGAGVGQGLGLGNNTLAALITRGLAEITRLAVAMGGQPKTLAGLAGLGDLVLTCSGELSRNRKVGFELAHGRDLAEILGSMNMIAEGVDTCDAAVELGEKFEVDLPIIQQMHAVLHAAKSPREAVRELMDRSLKGE